MSSPGTVEVLPPQPPVFFIPATAQEMAWLGTLIDLAARAVTNEAERLTCMAMVRWYTRAALHSQTFANPPEGTA